MGNMTCCIPHSASDHNFDKSAIFSPRRGDGSSLDLPHISEREGKNNPSSYTEISIREMQVSCVDNATASVLPSSAGNRSGIIMECFSFL